MPIFSTNKLKQNLKFEIFSVLLRTNFILLMNTRNLHLAIDARGYTAFGEITFDLALKNSNIFYLFYNSLQCI